MADQAVLKELAPTGKLRLAIAVAPAPSAQFAIKDGDSYRVLARNAKPYGRNRWHKLRVVLKGPAITVYLDGEKDLEATDATFSKGTFALYAWGCAGAKFRNVRWK